MKGDYQKLMSSGSIIFDLVLTGLFFIFMTNVCMDHVPAETFTMRLFFGSFTAVSLTGVFWLAIACLRVTWVDQVRRKKEGKQ